MKSEKKLTLWQYTKSQKLHWAVLLVVIVILSYLIISSFTPSQREARAFHSHVHDSRELAVDWFVDHLGEDGYFTYSFNPETGEISQDENDVRQLRAARTLAKLASEGESYLELHRRNISAILSDWYQVSEEGHGYVLFADASKLGANAALLQTLVASPLFANYTDEAEALVAGILSLRDQDDLLSPWYIQAVGNRADNEKLTAIYSGEAILALLEYSDRVGDRDLFEQALGSLNAHVQTYVSDLESSFEPLFVPSYTRAMQSAIKMQSNIHYLPLIFGSNDRLLLELFDARSQYKGRFFNPEQPEYGGPHAAYDGAYTESIAYAYELAYESHDVLRTDAYRLALRDAATHLSTLQYIEPHEGYLASFETYRGGMKTSVNDPSIRIDNVQHAIDTYTKVLGLIEEGKMWALLK